MRHGSHPAREISEFKVGDLIMPKERDSWRFSFGLVTKLCITPDESGFDALFRVLAVINDVPGECAPVYPTFSSDGLTVVSRVEEGKS